MTTAATVPPLSELAAYSLHQFTLDQYHRMIEEDIINEQDRVELLEGWIVEKMGHNPPHIVCVRLLERALWPRLSAGWDLRGQGPITTNDSEPEPDVSVVRGDPRSWLHNHPGPQDLAVVIEVADSSLLRDRIDKARLYARAGIARYWIVNLVERQVEVYTDPTGPDPAPVYRNRQDFGPGAAVPLILDGKEVACIPVQELLP